MPTFTDQDLEHCLPSLRRFAVSLTRCPTEAEDLVQDTVERALARADGFAPGTNLRAWLFTICRNHFLSGRRKRSATRDAVPLDEAGLEVPVPARQDDRLVMRDLVRGFDQLSAVDRHVLTAVALGGMRYDEAARRMRVEVGTVKSRVSRARARLHAALQGETGVPRAA